MYFRARSGGLPVCLTSRGSGLPTFTPARCAHPVHRTGPRPGAFRLGHELPGHGASAACSCTGHLWQSLTCARQTYAGLPCSRPQRGSLPAASTGTARRPSAACRGAGQPRRSLAFARPSALKRAAGGLPAAPRGLEQAARAALDHFKSGCFYGAHTAAHRQQRLATVGAVVANCTPTRICRTLVVWSAACSRLGAPARQAAPCSASAWQPCTDSLH